MKYRGKIQDPLDLVNLKYVQDAIPTELAELSDDSSHRLVTDAEKTSWNSKDANVQSDWNQTDSTADDYIKNKPDFVAVTNAEIDAMFA